jgi:hypothetical protein
VVAAAERAAGADGGFRMPAKEWKVTVARSAFAKPRLLEFDNIGDAVSQAKSCCTSELFEKSGGFVIISKGNHHLQEWRESPEGGHFMFPGDFDHTQAEG